MKTEGDNIIFERLVAPSSSVIGQASPITAKASALDRVDVEAIELEGMSAIANFNRAFSGQHSDVDCVQRKVSVGVAKAGFMAADLSCLRNASEEEIKAVMSNTSLKFLMRHDHGR